LFAQLTGMTVDQFSAHARQHGLSCQTIGEWMAIALAFKKVIRPTHFAWSTFHLAELYYFVWARVTNDCPASHRAPTSASLACQSS
jgi:hypothetical protein